MFSWRRPTRNKWGAPGWPKNKFDLNITELHLLSRIHQHWVLLLCHSSYIMHSNMSMTFSLHLAYYHPFTYCSSHYYSLSPRSQRGILLVWTCDQLLNLPKRPLICETTLLNMSIIIGLSRNQYIGRILMCERDIPERELMCEQIWLEGQSRLF